MKNNPRIEFTDLFNKQRKAALVAIKRAFLETLTIFLEDPYDPSLRNHNLKEKLAGYRSSDITDDWRSVFKETQSRDQKIITFQMIGTHGQLSGK
jgi:mRNA-degrading endonuclease YafQ of YafQ-DinJ toxin-antitoxin module